MMSNWPSYAYIDPFPLLAEALSLLCAMDRFTDVTLGASQHLSCHHCTHHTDLIAASWVGERCLTSVEAWSTSFGMATNLEMRAYQNQSSIFPHGLDLTKEGCCLLHSSATAFLFASKGLWLVLRYGLRA
jgi:hypothetical protein